MTVHVVIMYHSETTARFLLPTSCLVWTMNLFIQYKSKHACRICCVQHYVYTISSHTKKSSMYSYQIKIGSLRCETAYYISAVCWPQLTRVIFAIVCNIAIAAELVY